MVLRVGTEQAVAMTASTLRFIVQWPVVKVLQAFWGVGNSALCYFIIRALEAQRIPKPRPLGLCSQVQRVSQNISLAPVFGLNLLFV